MPFSDLERIILEQDLCTHCGACAVACPEDIIEIDELSPGLRFDAAEERCGQCTDCLQVCPGLDPQTPRVEQRLFGRSRTSDERWLGIYNDLKGCRSADDELYTRSGSGGATVGILAHAMDHLRLDWALVCGREAQRPWRAAPVICNQSASIRDYCQSTYQLAPHLLGLYGILRDEAESCGGVVGLACHLQALRRLQELDSVIGERARVRIGFTIEIACSSNTLPSGTETLLTDDLGLDLKDVSEVSYRDATLPGIEYPGVFSVGTRDGGRHTLPLWHVVRTLKEHKTHRCLSCPDWLSGLADISVFDGDPNIFVSSVAGSSEYSKHGTILVRTPIGSDVLESGTKAGVLEVWDTQLRTGNLGLERKRSRRALYERLQNAIPKPPIPDYIEPGDVVDEDRLLAVPDDLLLDRDKAGRGE